ncbi:MAG: 50S ribosomal protein L35 [Alphaproteobacteria bacterium]|nr:50S ribosomal protein L35 [Alphaproteobacteria bacterium]
MPKLKTRSAFKLRFRLTASGKVKTSRAGHNHFMRRKSSRSLTEAVHGQYLEGSDKKIVARSMPYGMK